MPEPRILVLAPALDDRESADSLERLQQTDLPGATKYLVTHGKMEVGGSVKTLNAAGGYPAEPAHLQTQAAWAGVPAKSDPRLRDGYALFCVARLLERENAADYLLLLNDAGGLREQWPQRKAEADARLLTSFRGQSFGTNLLLKTSDVRTPELLHCLWSLYQSGAVYGLTPYSLDAAVDAAHEALRFSSVATSTQSA